VAANKPYEQQREEKIESLIAPKDAARLKEIENEWGTAIDDRIRALCMERFRILLGPYFSILKATMPAGRRLRLPAGKWQVYAANLRLLSGIWIS